MAGRGLLVAGLLLLANVPAYSDESPHVGGHGGADGVLVDALVTRDGGDGNRPPHNPWSPSDDAGSEHNYIERTLEPVCSGAGNGSTVSGAVDCGMAPRCVTGDVLASVFQRDVTHGASKATYGLWQHAGVECVSFDPDDPPEEVVAPARVTWEMVLREVERVGLPSLQVQIQPADRTLVNFETNFYAVPETFERTVTLLGQRVDVRATPTQFAWDFGDGAVEETETAGMPYPDLQVTHAYSDADVTVAPRVDVTYAAEFRVSGAAWQDIPEAVTISGPPSSLRILEATPVLSGEGQDR